jgi:hypothetical protein
MLRRLIVMMVFVVYPLHAQYLDPGTASYILQILAAVALTSLFFIKQIIAFIKRGLTKLFGKYFGKTKGD